MTGGDLISARARCAHRMIASIAPGDRSVGYPRGYCPRTGRFSARRFGQNGLPYRALEKPRDPAHELPGLPKCKPYRHARRRLRRSSGTRNLRRLIRLAIDRAVAGDRHSRSAPLHPGSPGRCAYPKALWCDRTHGRPSAGRSRACSVAKVFSDPGRAEGGDRYQAVCAPRPGSSLRPDWLARTEDLMGPQFRAQNPIRSRSLLSDTYHRSWD